MITIADCFNILESDFEDLAARLRQHAAETVKIEMIPWVKEYVTKPKDCYIHPTLKKVKPKPETEIEWVLGRLRVLDKSQTSDY